MHYILYTTSRPKWYQEQADIFAREISKTKGRGEVKITVVRKAVKTVKLSTDSDGDFIIDWKWFQATFPQYIYDGVIFHFTPTYRRKWNIDSSINGARNQSNRDYPEFWICCDQGEMAKGYDNLYEFLRLLFHEHAHYDEDVDDMVGDKLTQNTVHDVDYKLKQIHKYHLLVDYRGQAIKQGVMKVMTAVIQMAKKYI